MGGRFELSGIKVGGMTVNLRVKGAGEQIVLCSIDGRKVANTVIPIDDRLHDVEITIKQ